MVRGGIERRVRFGIKVDHVNVTGILMFKNGLVKVNRLRHGPRHLFQLVQIDRLQELSNAMKRRDCEWTDGWGVLFE